MAGDWIKIESCLPDKPEVQLMASILNLDSDAVVGKLSRIWIWADQQSISGNALRVTDSFLDRITHCPGFAAAMRKVDWLEGRELALSFPRFDRHNGQTAKARALTKKRVAEYRNDSVTHEPLPEKRREENISIPTREKVIEYGKTIECSEEDCLSFWNHFESQGWVKSSGLPLTQWKPRLETWKLDQVRKRSTSQRRENGSEGASPRPMSPWEAVNRVEEATKEIRRLKADSSNYSYVSPDNEMPRKEIKPEAAKRLKQLEQSLSEARSVKSGIK